MWSGLYTSRLWGFIWCILTLFLAAKWHFKGILPKLFHSALNSPVPAGFGSMFQPGSSVAVVLLLCFPRSCGCFEQPRLQREQSNTVRWSVSRISQTPACFPAAAEAGLIKGGAMQQWLSSFVPLVHLPCRQTHDWEPRSDEKSSEEEEKEDTPLSRSPGGKGRGG